MPPDLLAAMLTRHPASDPRVILGPRPGEDAAVIDLGGPDYLTAKTDRITFVTDEIGWYAINVNANDLAATGGIPVWFMATILLPEGITDEALVTRIFDQSGDACSDRNISFIGGTARSPRDIDRPIISGVMLGTVPRDRLIRTGGAQPGDRILVTKGMPVEATAMRS